MKVILKSGKTIRLNERESAIISDQLMEYDPSKIVYARFAGTKKTINLNDISAII